ncbi:MAG: peptide-methionine (S)-S-oxide reductase MsrA [Planctomycetaceae bacterium]
MIGQSPCRFLASRLILAIGVTTFLAVSPVFSQAPSTSSKEKPVNAKADNKESVVTLAGGCFWCTEAVYERMEGVNDVVSGYIGGTMVNPDYESVCRGNTGHAEAVEIYYDPSVTSYEEILKVFFKTHDPTSLNRQGADVGTQYRSAIFYHDEAEKKAAEAFIAKINGEFGGRIVTTLEPAATFYPAEEYHQDYYRKNPTAGYCRAVVRTKVKKFENIFEDKVKKDKP